MLINLSEILSNELKKEHYECEIAMNEFSYCGMEYPLTEKSLVVMDIEQADKRKVRVNGSFSVCMVIPCDRCLEDVPKQFSITFDKILDFSEDELENEENLMKLSFAEGAELDVDVLVYDELLTALPMKVLCDTECKGLCPVCGTNRNQTSCTCNTKVPDPRMAAIRDIFNKSKEV